MAITSKAISKAIYKETGYNVTPVKGGGCVAFFGDDEVAEDMLSRCYSTTVYVYALNHLTIEQWVAEFKSLIEDSERHV